MTHVKRITLIVKLNLKLNNKSSLFDYNDACILVSRTITVVGRGAGDVARVTDRRNKQAIFKNRAQLK